MSDDMEDVIGELMDEASGSGGRVRRPRRRVAGTWVKMFAVGLALVAVASMALAAYVLFTQNPTYSAIDNLHRNCATPTGTINGTLIVFSCGLDAAFYVTPAATGSVHYSTFSHPSNITDAYLVDVSATPASACGSFTKPGFEPIQLQFSGGQINIGTTVGTFRANHAFNYCEDVSPPVASYSFNLTWTQP
jgi:hypothetical protein